VSTPGRPSRRTLVEQCAQVSARRLNGLDFPEWNLGGRDVLITHTWGSGKSTTFQVSILGSPQPCGGLRFWYSCPGCSRRVGRLYSPSPDDPFKCRKCWHLGYRSELYVPPAARAFLRLLRRMRGFTPPEGLGA
jgi:hypothetical protein